MGDDKDIDSRYVEVVDHEAEAIGRDVHVRGWGSGPFFTVAWIDDNMVGLTKRYSRKVKYVVAISRCYFTRKSAVFILNKKEKKERMNKKLKKNTKSTNKRPKKSLPPAPVPPECQDSNDDVREEIEGSEESTQDPSSPETYMVEAYSETEWYFLYPSGHWNIQTVRVNKPMELSVFPSLLREKFNLHACFFKQVGSECPDEKIKTIET